MNPVDVSASARAEHAAVSRRGAGKGVAGRIIVRIRFGFDDTDGALASPIPSHEVAPEQPLGGFYDVF